MQKIVTHLWFDGQAEEAARYYTAIFQNSRVKAISRYGESGAKVSGRPVGSVMTVAFQLGGQDFVALNGGPQFRFSEAISLLVNCETQDQIDTLWDALSQGGETSVCGWLKDKYGLSWQIVPAGLDKMIMANNPERLERVMQAILQMTKLDIAKLQQAYDSK